MPDVTTKPVPASRRSAPFPPWVYMAAGIAVSAAPFLLLWLGGAEAIRDFFFALYHRLGLIQPFSLIPLYFHEVTKCVEFDVGGITHCQSSWLMIPVRLPGALFGTAGIVLSTSDAAGIVVLILALIAGYFIALGIVKSVFGVSETGALTMLASAALTPLVASLVALVLQGVAMLLSIVIAYIIVAILWAAGALRGAWEFYKKAQEVNENAKRVEEMHLRYLEAGEPPAA